MKSLQEFIMESIEDRDLKLSDFKKELKKLGINLHWTDPEIDAYANPVNGKKYDGYEDVYPCVSMDLQKTNWDGGTEADGDGCINISVKPGKSESVQLVGADMTAGDGPGKDTGNRSLFRYTKKNAKLLADAILKYA